MKTNTHKHFSLEDRIQLLHYIIKGFSIRKTATCLNKSPSSVSRELKKHRYLTKGFESSKCMFVRDCRKGPNCHVSCDRYTPDFCSKLLAAPWICNACENFKHCRKDKYRYDPNRAHKQYLHLLSSSREGANSSLEALHHFDDLVSERIKEKGQSLYHVFQSDDCSAPFSISTAYRYIDKGYLTVKNIDLPRRVRYARRKANSHKSVAKAKKFTINRKIEDFHAFVEKHPKASQYEMDTVIGVREGGHKVLLTILLRESNFMFAFLLDEKTANAVNQTFDSIEETISASSFTNLFYAGLTDNGSEFSDPDYLEAIHRRRKRTHLFYCDAMQSQQKGKIEKNHEYIRLFVPQGSLFDDFSQSDITLMMNHINSVKRPQFDGKSPFDMLPRHLRSIVSKLGYQPIKEDDICLNMSLFKK